MNTSCTLGKPNMGKTELEGEAYDLLFFFSIMKHKYKEGGAHYGVFMDTMANMAIVGSSTCFVLLQHLTPRCSTRAWKNRQYNKNGTPSFPSSLVFNIA